MTIHAIEVATAAEEATVVDVLTLAFIGDPVVRWCWDDPHLYLEHFPRFIRAFGGRAFGRGSAHRVDGYAGAALWLPPGVEPDEEAIGVVLQSTVPAPVQRDVFAVTEQMAGYHPGEPHWYLPLIGIDPPRQGKGRGAALLKHALAGCDRDGSAAYLESTNPKNIPLYESHGFEATGRIQAGGSPVITPMLRRARGR